MLISKFGNTSNKFVSEFENIMGFTFPKQYRTFIEKYNGGETPLTHFNINGISSDLKGFYGVGNVKYSLDSIQIEEINKICYLPIAMDSFGNSILIEINKGEIFFKDHENGNVTKIGSSLVDFINKCESKVVNKNSIKSVEEREQDLISCGRGDIITDSLRNMWRAEIKKNNELVQEEIVL